MSRFLNKYRDEVIPALTKQFGYKTEMQVPRITMQSTTRSLLTTLSKI